MPARVITTSKLLHTGWDGRWLGSATWERNHRKARDKKHLGEQPMKTGLPVMQLFTHVLRPARSSLSLSLSLSLSVSVLTDFQNYLFIRAIISGLLL